MHHPYFYLDERDRDFYSRHIAGRLPDKILDAHVHMTLPEHTTGVPKTTIDRIWALQYGMVLPYEEAIDIAAKLFPGKRFSMLAFPWPLHDADTEANNATLSALAKEGKLQALMSVRPEWSAEYCERMLTEGGFLGFKPYPFMKSEIEDDEISIFDYMPRHQLEVLNRYKKALLLHLPRHGRLPDDNNLRELRDIRQSFPDITIVLAHFGKCFGPEHFEAGMKKLGGDKDAFYYDTTGITEPGVYRRAFDALNWKNIIHGTDMPIFLFHGRMVWKDGGLFLICREDFGWNKHEAGSAKEQECTQYIYEQIAMTLDALDAAGGGSNDAEDIFRRNAMRAYGIAHFQQSGV